MGPCLQQYGTAISVLLRNSHEGPARGLHLDDAPRAQQVAEVEPQPECCAHQLLLLQLLHQDLRVLPPRNKAEQLLRSPVQGGERASRMAWKLPNQLRGNKELMKSEPDLC